MARPQFSSRLATLLAMAAFAVGVGNVWRFPYVMGQNGGSAFLLIYLLFVLMLAVPALVAEWSLGRATQSGPVTAFKAAYGKAFGLPLGFLALFTIFMALSYYCIVVGSVLYSAWFATVTGFHADTLVAYQDGLANNLLQYFMAAGLTIFCLWIVKRGLKRGIEAMNNLLMPVFAVVALYMVGVALTLDGAIPKLAEFFKPDFSRAGPDVWFAAMGQACFSIGISGAVGVMYGSYLRNDEKLLPSATSTGLIDTGAALLASLFVVPAVLVFGLDMAQGPTLLFNTLPELFNVMPGGRWLAGPFLAAWGLVAVLTIVAAFETVISGLEDYFGERLSRLGLILVIGGLLIAVMLPIAFNPQVIGTLDVVFGSAMFMFGCMMAVIGVGWGLGKAALKVQVAYGLGERTASLLTFWIRWVVPAALLSILAGYILSSTGLI
ncbi:MAG: sodium-dependent transporter [Xanthomonadales bacterium]|nr:sodium-dependent transporter [Xanthomonadales bacterium]